MFWREKVERFAIQQGESVEVSIDLESRGYNGRWYTDVKAWEESRNASGNENMYFATSGESYPNGSAMLNGDDIPF